MKPACLRIRNHGYRIHRQPAPPRDKLAEAIETLEQIQVLCARGAPLEDIWQLAEYAITCARSRH